MKKQTQLLKGVLEGCILLIIEQEETYGYEISQKLADYGFAAISEGSIYPLLLRLQKEKVIEGSIRKSKAGPKRKYYHLTDEGKKRVELFTSDWKSLAQSVNRLIDEWEGTV